MGEFVRALISRGDRVCRARCLPGRLYWLTKFVPKSGRRGLDSGCSSSPRCRRRRRPADTGDRTIYLSLQDDNGKSFVGFDNYQTVFENTETRLTVFNSAVWVVVGTIFTVIIGLAVARFADNIRGEKALQDRHLRAGSGLARRRGSHLVVRLRRPTVRERSAQRDQREHSRASRQHGR